MARKFSPGRVFLFINSLFIAGVFVIGADPQAFQTDWNSRSLSEYLGQNISFSGRVCEEAEVDYKSRKLTVCTPERVLITTNLYPTYDYGDTLSVSGLLKAPEPFNGFNYDQYLARYDIYALMYYPKIRLDSEQSGLSSTDANRLSLKEKSFRSLLIIKGKARDLINSGLPEPEAGLANALLLGYRKTVNKEDLAIFSRVGLSHMIAISGSHITILSAMIINFLLAFKLRRRTALKMVFAFLIIYPLMTGLSASAVRSAIMGGLALLAMYYGRPSSLIYSLVLAAAVMLALNPLLLRNDIGFQLSFLALLGIIYIYPIGEELSGRLLDRLSIRKQTFGQRTFDKRTIGKKMTRFIKTILDTINLTLVAQIVILPVAVINFEQLSVIAPLANVLVLWTFPLLLAALIGGLVLSALLPVLGVVWFFPAHCLLKYIFVMAELLARPDWAAATVTWFNWRGGVLYYLGLLVVTVILRRLVRPLIKPE
jgi:competence protein ComEC